MSLSYYKSKTAWYLKNPIRSIVGIIMFLYLINFTYFAVLQLISLFVVTNAVINSLFVKFGTLIVLWSVPFIPTILLLYLFIGIPAIWELKQFLLKKLFLVILFGLIIYIVASWMSNFSANLIAGIANRNPCAAERAGITGTIPCDKR